MIGLTKTSTLEYADASVRVNAVRTGLIMTPMVESAVAQTPDFMEQPVSTQPVGRPATVEEVARTVVWLCSDAATFVTGIAMPIGGGIVAQ